MSHPVVLALFEDAAAAAAAARALRTLGVPRERVSIVARSHDEEGVVADASGGSPGSEIEDSAAASRLGELGAHLLAAIALVMPGIGPIVADGPLAAGMGEAAGHLAGGIPRTLERAGLSQADAHRWEARIRGGALLVGAHVEAGQIDRAREVLTGAGGRDVSVGRWAD
ncbi:MAG: hypothetical protein HY824_16510 [Acidobacteria bacterium]|nr:hypothetical protein [Acidobacteriota bacterium]